jgi:hypothetical protein
MRWTYYNHIDKTVQGTTVKGSCTHLGFEQIMSYRCDRNFELMRQFYSTIYISADESSMTCMVDGRMNTVNKRACEERLTAG